MIAERLRGTRRAQERPERGVEPDTTAVPTTTLRGHGSIVRTPSPRRDPTPPPVTTGSLRLGRAWVPFPRVKGCHGGFETCGCEHPHGAGLEDRARRPWAERRAWRCRTRQEPGRTVRTAGRSDSPVQPAPPRPDTSRRTSGGVAGLGRRAGSHAAGAAGRRADAVEGASMVAKPRHGEEGARVGRRLRGGEGSARIADDAGLPRPRRARRRSQASHSRGAARSRPTAGPAGARGRDPTRAASSGEGQGGERLHREGGAEKRSAATAGERPEPRTSRPEAARPRAPARAAGPGRAPSSGPAAQAAPPAPAAARPGDRAGAGRAAEQREERRSREGRRPARATRSTARGAAGPRAATRPRPGREAPAHGPRRPRAERAARRSAGKPSRQTRRTRLRRGQAQPGATRSTTRGSRQSEGQAEHAESARRGTEGRQGLEEPKQREQDEEQRGRRRGTKTARDPTGTHHQLSSQKDRDRNGTAVQGDRTTTSPGKSRSARRARRPRRSEVGSPVTRRRFYAGTISRVPLASLVAPASPWLLIALGGATGLVGSLLGLGGGVFLVPLLTLALGVPIRAADRGQPHLRDRHRVRLLHGEPRPRPREHAARDGPRGGHLDRRPRGRSRRGPPVQRQLFLLFGVTLGVMGVVMALRSGRRNVIADTGGRPRPPGRTHPGGRYDLRLPREAPAPGALPPRSSRERSPGCWAWAGGSSRCRS